MIGFLTPQKDRAERVALLDKFMVAIKAMLDAKEVDEKIVKVILSRLKVYVEKHITERILDKDQRLDGRSLTQIRDLKTEVALLPRTHGSGMFMRGDTQVLSVVTLGAPGDVQTIDTMEEDGTKRYMHHYSDTPATYGETGPLRGPGNRSIGHGALAERAWCRFCLRKWIFRTLSAWCPRSSVPMVPPLWLLPAALLWP